MSTDKAAPARYQLTLYVSGASPNSLAAVDNIQRMCAGPLAGRVDLEIVDVRHAPALLVRDHVPAVPALVRHLPGPPRHFVGNMADPRQVTLALDLDVDHPDQGLDADKTSRDPPAGA